MFPIYPKTCSMFTMIRAAMELFAFATALIKFAFIFIKHDSLGDKGSYRMEIKKNES